MIVQMNGPYSISKFFIFLFKTYDQFHNILRLFDVLPIFSFTTSETMPDYYL